MYARAHSHVVNSSLATNAYSSTASSSSSSPIVVLKPNNTPNNGGTTASLPQTSRHRPTTNLVVVVGSSPPQHQQLQTSLASAAFIGEFTYPGEVNSTNPSQSTTTTTTASLIRPSAPGTVEDEQFLTQVEIPPHQTAQVHKRTNANLIEKADPDMAASNSRQRQKQISVAASKPDPKQLATSLKLSDEVLKQYQEAFRIFDRDGDGCITCQELGTVMKSLGNHPSEDELQDMIHEVDVDGSGTIEFDEFVQMMARRLNEKGGEEDGEEELKEAFEVFDRNKDGYITAEELRQVMRSLGENLTDKELNEMMKAADANGDGIINFNEFQEVWIDARHETTK